jgi:hypothetical protein
MKPVFRETLVRFKEKEKEIVEKIFEKGIKKGIFSIDDTGNTASLFLDLLKGLRVSVVNDKRTMFIDQDEYDSLKIKTLAFTELFIKGISLK